MKQVTRVSAAPAKHWVGDGFYVSSMFSYTTHGEDLSPFLLLDHAAPKQFEPSQQKRGVGEHPHRGFETVTIVYSGEVSHKDSTGAGGTIGPGDVQWMTAGSGILHEEFHSETFTQTGGMMEMAQLWVNLPAKDKMIKPSYQDIASADIPTINLEDIGSLRLIAGKYQGYKGAANTYSPLNVMDLRLNVGKSISLQLNEGWSGGIVVLRGELTLNKATDNETQVKEHQLAVLTHNGETIDIQADSDAKLLILSGEPLAEPIVGYGPFVMNSREEIEQALQDFRDGQFGSL
ncbi:MAG: pirin family protein [Gammaproteobacteria bacterium]|nr:pirin family protein [Gammaproteobacteria bacterium]